MYKRILVAVDGSGSSDRAFLEATKLAQDQHATLRIVYAVNEVNFNAGAEFPPLEDITNALVKAGEDILGKAKKQALAAGVETETHLIEIGRVGLAIAPAIVEDAKSWEADLLVAGTMGRSGLAHLLMGSVAEGIVRICPLPVLLLRAQ